MVTQASRRGDTSPIALWRNMRARRMAAQTVFIVFIAVAAWVLIDNLTSELDRTNLDAFPFVSLDGDAPFIHIQKDFLGQRAGFNLKETSFGVDYSANDSYRKAFVAGLSNTFRVAILGLVLASALGLVAGVARLSKNWLVSHLAAAYVEIFRNVPLLVQLIFWYTAVALRLPRIQDSIDIFGVMLISNRSVAVFWAEARGNFGMWAIVLLVALVAAAIVKTVLARQQDATGKPRYPWWSASGVLLLIAVVSFFATGGPLEFQRPELEGRVYIGGAQMSPEFAALVVGLVLYTGAFIAEVVRASVLSVPRGQDEAAAALGLKPLERLRHIVLPQALRIMIPPLTNQYLNLTKNTSLAVAVAYPDVFQVTRVTINQTGQAVPMIALVMLTYLTISLSIAAVMNLIYNRGLGGGR